MNAIILHSRLQAPPSLPATIDAGKWRVLCETTFPNARTPEAIIMALDYCRARGLDIFKKPVHIVPMWNSSLNREVETIWPGINEIQITAARTGQWAGMDVPVWGAPIKREFVGRRRVKGSWEQAKATVDFPEWCSVTVYRMINRQRCPFTEPVFWLEAYSRAGGANSELPTDMWIKRPHGQLHKVAKAAALRAAFPEEGEYTAEEMEGKEIDQGGVVVEDQSAPMASGRPIIPSPDAELEPEASQEDDSVTVFMDKCRAHLETLTTEQAVKDWWASDDLGKVIAALQLPQERVDTIKAWGMERRKAIRAASGAPQAAPNAPAATTVAPVPQNAQASPYEAGEEACSMLESNYTAGTEALETFLWSLKGKSPEVIEAAWEATIGQLPAGMLLPPDLKSLQAVRSRILGR